MPAIEPRTVLVVDDDPGVLVALQKRLSSEGHRVVLARSGEEALEQTATRHVDAVLLDRVLPGPVDGLQVAYRLHEDPATRGLPIIFVTGDPGDDFKRDCAFVQVPFFVTKPYDPDVLLQLLRGVFAQDAVAEMQRIATFKRRQPIA